MSKTVELRHSLDDLFGEREVSEAIGVSKRRAQAIMKEIGAFNVSGTTSKELRIWKQDLICWLQRASENR